MLLNDIAIECAEDLGADATDSALVGQFFKWVKYSLRRLPLYCRQRAITTIKAVTLEAGAQQVTLPSGFIKEKRDGVWYDSSSGKRCVIEILGIERYNDERSATGALGNPKSGHIVGNVLQFDRSADVAYTINFECFQEIDNVVAGDTWVMPSTVIEIVKDWVKWYYWANNDDKSEFCGMYLNLATKGMNELDAQYMASELPGYVEDKQGTV